jgi:ribosome-binding protein aMBF1 (putative translation factor)
MHYTVPGLPVFRLGIHEQQARLTETMPSEQTKARQQNQASAETPDPPRDFVIQRIRESLTWLRRTPTRNSTPYQKVERNIRDSIRQLSRQRVSDLLRQLRAAHGLSYEQVNERTGLTQQLLFDVEFKDRRLTLDEIRRLADCYQVSLDDILGINVDS